MEEKKIQIINKSRHQMPQYETAQSAGMDLRANIDNPITLHGGQTAVIPTGIYIALPEGYEAQVRPRSGLAAKYGVTVCNAPGTIDADYRGEIKVILINHCNTPFHISDGDRIAQMVISRYERVVWEPVSELPLTERGDGGFGHTGVN